MRNIVFDMDGVIFDTETLCLRSWKHFEESFKMKHVEEAFNASIGANRQWALEVLKKMEGEDFPAEEFLHTAGEWQQELIETEGLPMKDGAKELLEWLKEQNFKLALASSTRIAVVEKELKMAGLYDYFDVVVGGDMVSKSKPNPDIYLHACKLLNVDPKESFAVEDSYNGVRSACSAGMKTIMVPDRLEPTEEMEELAYSIQPNLAGVKELLEMLHKNFRN